MLDLRSSDSSREFQRSPLIYFALLNILCTAWGLDVLRYLKLEIKSEILVLGPEKTLSVRPENLEVR